jgi:hypothetical protein
MAAKCTEKIDIKKYQNLDFLYAKYHLSILKVTLVASSSILKLLTTDVS